MNLEAWAVYSKLFWVLFVFIVTFTAVNCFIARKCSRIWSSENIYWLVNFEFFGTTQHANKISGLELTNGGINFGMQYKLQEKQWRTKYMTMTCSTHNAHPFSYMVYYHFL